MWERAWQGHFPIRNPILEEVMKNLSLLLLITLLTMAMSFAQDTALLPNAPSFRNDPQPGMELAAHLEPALAKGASADSDAGLGLAPPSYKARFGSRDKFGCYLSETYLNASLFTAPAFRAGLRMANPPGKGATRYPLEWRQGAEGFGRNYGDAFAQRLSFHTARFASGALIHEDPRYIPSGSHNMLARSVHALTFTLVDRSDSGHAMPAISNFIGAAAAGFAGNAYLPAGFNNATHAGQRATLQFGMTAAGNLFREFAPQMPRPVRTFVQLIAR
jgi:hypothetical protein